jgi:hypothetical protein
MKLDWLKDRPETTATARYVYGSESRSLDNCSKIVSRVYAGENTEYTANVFMINLPKWAESKLESLQAIHAVNWQSRGIWDFDLAQYALIYGEDQLFLSLQAPASTPFKLSCGRYLEAVLYRGAVAPALEFAKIHPHWSSEFKPAELMELCRRCYGCARSSELYQQDPLGLGFDTRLGSIDQDMLAYVKTPGSHHTDDNQVDDFLIDNLQTWLCIMYEFEAFERGVKLALHYWTHVHRDRELPIKLSEVDDEHPSLSRLLGWIPLPGLLDHRTPTARLKALIDQFYIDDRKLPE